MIFRKQKPRSRKDCNSYSVAPIYIHSSLFSSNNKSTSRPIQIINFRKQKTMKSSMSNQRYQKCQLCGAQKKHILYSLNQQKQPIPKKQFQKLENIKSPLKVNQDFSNIVIDYKDQNKVNIINSIKKNNQRVILNTENCDNQLLSNKRDLRKTFINRKKFIARLSQIQQKIGNVLKKKQNK